MRFELINPSDKYLFEAPSLEVAALSVLLLGHGNYGAKQVDGDAEVPLFLLGGNPDPWFEENFGRTLKASVQIADREQLAATLRSLEIPGPGSHDEKRTSMNDLRSRALRLADQLVARGAA